MTSKQRKLVTGGVSRGRSGILSDKMTDEDISNQTDIEDLSNSKNLRNRFILLCHKRKDTDRVVLRKGQVGTTEFTFLDEEKVSDVTKTNTYIM